ncbi:MAG: hypothetical protein KDC95_18725 [Planctomycetes bacterium]|nr:hypothetical protein [Planctomycetota bacterium]
MQSIMDRLRIRGVALDHLCSPIQLAYGAQIEEAVTEKIFELTRRGSSELYCSRRRVLRYGVLAWAETMEADFRTQIETCGGGIFEVVAPEGAGKSTFITRVLEPKRQHRGRFVLFLEGRWQSMQACDEICRQIVKGVADFFSSHVVEDDHVETYREYALYRDRWSDGLNAEALREAEDPLAFKRDLAQSTREKGDEREAVRRLGFLTNPGDDLGFDPVDAFLVIDNIDQLSDATQVQIMKLVQRLHHDVNSVASKLHIILPMRPETRRMLSPHVEPTERNEFVLGELALDEVLQRRSDFLASIIASDHDPTETALGFAVCRGDAKVFYELLPADSTGMLTQALNPDLGIIDPENEGASSRRVPAVWARGRGYVRVDDSVKDMQQNFCDGSVRRSLAMVKRVAKSQVLFSKSRRYRDPKLTKYYFLDAWLTSSFGYMRMEDTDLQAVNLFGAPAFFVESRMGSDASGDADVTQLVPWMVLDLLIGRDRTTLTALHGALQAFGIPRGRVKDALNALHNIGCLRVVASDDPADPRYECRRRSLLGLYAIATEPAYVDNVAQISPIPDDVVERVMWTKSWDPTHFLTRAWQSIRFLRFIRGLEAKALARVSSEDSSGVELHRWSDMAVKKYSGRIRRISDNPRDLRKHVDGSDWTSMLGALDKMVAGDHGA